MAVHDGVRPLVSERLIADAFTLAEAFGAAVPVMPLNETIREIREGQARVVDRSYLFTVQTPQAFATSLLKKAYLQEYRKEFTDDATLVEALGHRIQGLKSLKEAYVPGIFDRKLVDEKYALKC